MDPSAPIAAMLESLIAEIQAQPLPVACISSEELEHLHVRPNNLARLSAGLTAIGFRTVVAVYLRPQADYLEALYAEVSRHAPVRDFWACYREILKHGGVDLWPQNRFTTLRTSQHGLLRSSVEKNILVRPYRRHRNPEALVEDFMQAITGRRNSTSAMDVQHVGSAEPRQARSHRQGPPAHFEDRHSHAVRERLLVARIGWRRTSGSLVKGARRGRCRTNRAMASGAEAALSINGMRTRSGHRRSTVQRPEPQTAIPAAWSDPGESFSAVYKRSQRSWSAP